MSIRWEKPPTPTTRTTRGFDGEQHVATIVRARNHTRADKRAYAVTVFGVEMPGLFESIDEARAAGDAEYERQREQASN